MKYTELLVYFQTLNEFCHS